MNRVSKTLSHIGSYFMLASLVPIMIIAVFMMSVHKLAVTGFAALKDVGEWLNSLSGEALMAIASIGVSIFIFTLIIFGVITFFLIFINSRKAYKQRIGYFVGIFFGIILVIATLLPLIIVSSTVNEGVWTLMMGMLFIFAGLSGITIATGSIFGIFAAKTLKEEIEIKTKK
ncbi:hypothetical protein [Spiroplasma culicicola]|uniref:Transmembrane protein n=1 Tax=Spiroplasma culicicola AES-1 TaxID=1276246 RepID=W6A751_9MOLU|nr:hypothetical protein [Spiroplasma culicicola]AHI52817.1 hypothetical protein SCULI_v1c04760 [Spiroplasma culicicola AES-1]